MAWTRVNNCTAPVAAQPAMSANFHDATVHAPVIYPPQASAELDSAWLALGACPWPRLILDPEKKARRGTLRQLAEWQAEALADAPPSATT